MPDTAPPLDLPPPTPAAVAPPAASPPVVDVRPRRPLVAAAAGLAVAAAVAALRTTGVLEGHLALLVAFLLVLAVPSSRLGVRRLLLAAGCAAGVLPALWWWDLPLGGAGRVGLLLALLAGGLTTVLLWQGPRAVRTRARLLVPAWRPVDLAVAATAALAALACRGLLAVRTGAESLAALLPAWDSSAHVDMVLMLRRSGAVIPSLPAPAVGEAWKFADYPQGHHAVVATLVELLGSATPGANAAELVLLVRAQGFVLAAVAVVLVAGLCALPTAPRRPGVVALGSAAVAGVVLLGPGATAFTSGFPNFVLGCAMAAAAVLLAVTVPRVLAPAPLIALGGLVVGVAQCWVPLLALVLPAVALAAVPRRWGAWRTSWHGGRRARGLGVVVALLTAAGLGVALATLRRLRAADVLLVPGGIDVPPAGLMLALVLAAVAVPLTARGRRTPWLALVPAAGLLAAAGVAALQLRGTGELSYYFWKLLLGTTLVAVVVLAAAAVLRPGPARSGEPGRTARWRGAAAVVVGCFALLQVHGLTGRSTGELRTTPAQVQQAADLLHAADVATATGRTDVVYVRGAGDLHPVNTQQWLLALTGTWTSAADARASALVVAGIPRDVAGLALAEGATLVVDAADLPGLGLTDAPADRVVSWG